MYIRICKQLAIFDQTFAFNDTAQHLILSACRYLSTSKVSSNAQVT